jgi:chromosome segregation ATPase
MISLDQIQLLGKKVESALIRIVELQNENAELQNKCAELETRNSELSRLVADFEQDQNTIEQGILSVLDRLNSIENTVLQTDSESTNSTNLSSFADEQKKSNEENILIENQNQTASFFEDNVASNTMEPVVKNQELDMFSDLPTKNTTEPSNGQLDIY